MGSPERQLPFERDPAMRIIPMRAGSIAETRDRDKSNRKLKNLFPASRSG